MAATQAREAAEAHEGALQERLETAALRAAATEEILLQEGTARDAGAAQALTIAGDTIARMETETARLIAELASTTTAKCVAEQKLADKEAEMGVVEGMVDELEALEIHRTEMAEMHAAEEKAHAETAEKAAALAEKHAAEEKAHAETAEKLSEEEAAHAAATAAAAEGATISAQEAGAGRAAVEQAASAAARVIELEEALAAASSEAAGASKGAVKRVKQLEAAVAAAEGRAYAAEERIESATRTSEDECKSLRAEAAGMSEQLSAGARKVC
jgi:colicin import membrane protein